MDCNKSESAEDILERCIKAGVAQEIPVKGLVAEWISFAGRYPDCFKELFTARKFSSMDYLADRIGHKEECLDYLRATLKYDEDGTLRLYHDILLQTYGLCCLAAFAGYKFSEQEIDVRLGRSVLMHIIGKDMKVQHMGDGNIADYLKEAVNSIITPRHGQLISDYVSRDGLVLSLHKKPRFVLDDEWLAMESLLNTVCDGFVEKLKSRFPEIGHATVRLAMLIKLEFDIDDAATLLGISKVSVYKSRQRMKILFGGIQPEKLIGRM